jgi:pectate lyase
MEVSGTFDGGMVRFYRGSTTTVHSRGEPKLTCRAPCGGQSEGGDKDAVFLVESGGTVKNVIIGADQSEGIHCLGPCTVESLGWEAVC